MTLTTAGGGVGAGRIGESRALEGRNVAEGGVPRAQIWKGIALRFRERHRLEGL
jgi:hypothetical protein